MKAILKPRETSGPNSFKAAIIVSRYHEEITSKLLHGALSAAKAHQIQTVETFWVPGAFEISQGVKAASDTNQFDVIVSLGCLIRGETAHFDYIARSVVHGLDETGRTSSAAVSFGVLTVDSFEQAQERAGGKWGNKGEEAMSAAIELAYLKRKLQNGKSSKSSRASASNSLSHRSR